MPGLKLIVYPSSSVSSSPIEIQPLTIREINYGPFRRLAVLTYHPRKHDKLVVFLLDEKMRIRKMLPAHPETIAAIFGSDISISPELLGVTVR